VFWNKPRTCEECEKLRREFKQLTLEVEAMLDKVYHWMKRQNSRQSRLPEAATDAEPEPVGEAPAGNGLASLTRAQRIARLNKRMGLG
jgi:hypothetical protein